MNLDRDRSAVTGDRLPVGGAAEFLFHEARLLDEHRYEQWLSLWAEEGALTYWVPCNEDDYDPTEHVSLIYDDRQRLAERVVRLRSPAAHSQDPPSRTVRLVANIEVLDATDSSVTVRSNQAIAEFRCGIQTTYFAAVTHDLDVASDGFRIRVKKVCLVNNDGHIRNLTFLL